MHIDESGTPTLGAGCYVLVGVTCSRAKQAKIDASIRALADQHCSGAELKSQRVRRPSQRNRICDAISELDIEADVLVVRKAAIDPASAMQYRQTMYKRCQRRLFLRVYRGLAGVSVVMDRYGRSKFMESFPRYIDKHFKPTLLRPKKSVRFAVSAETPLLQVADFISGTVRRHLEGRDDGSAVDALKARTIVHSEAWPRTPSDPPGFSHEDVDDQIESHCAYAAEEFLERSTDPLLSEIVDYLLYSAFDADSGFVYGDAILRHLEGMGLVEGPLDKTVLQQLVAKLREDGVVVVASRGGYKIPSSRHDVQIFLEFVANKTLNYLRRVQSMRHSIRRGTDSFDVLSLSPELKELFDSGVDAWSNQALRSDPSLTGG